MPGMKVALNAHLLSRQAGYRSAGICAYIENLLQRLPGAAGAGWKLQAMVGAGSEADYAGMGIIRSRMDTESPLRRILWEQTLQPFAIRGYDLYHALAFAAPLALSAPMVVTVYDLSFLRYPERLSPARRLYLRWMTALTCARARRILAISQSTADELEALLGIPRSKIDVTPLGYDKRRFAPRSEAECQRFRHGAGLPERFWLFVGTLEPRKNLPMLLRAYARLEPAERLPLLLGGGLGWRGAEVLAAIERLGLGGSVRHIGYIPAADLPLWYNSAEAFVYPSVYEGFGLPVLEAMACGLPVLTSNASSLPEVAGAVGLRLPPEDEDAWVLALRRAKDDADWREAAASLGLQRARQFSWARTATLTLGSYRKALAVGTQAQSEKARELD